MTKTPDAEELNAGVREESVTIFLLIVPAAILSGTRIPRNTIPVHNQVTCQVANNWMGMLGNWSERSRLLFLKC